MKNLKKGLFLSAICLTLALSAGCQKKAETKESSESIKVETKAPKESESEASGSEKYIVGTVVDASMHTLTIKTNDGQVYTFSTLGAKTDYKNGVAEGNWVSLIYTGKLEGTDTSKVTVKEIVDKDDNIEKAKQEMEIKAVDETVYATAGVHIRESWSTDSKIVGSLALGGSINRTGICGNGWSRVVYDGKDCYIYGDYLSTTAPKENASPSKTSGDKPGTPQTEDNKPAQVEQPTDTTTHDLYTYIKDMSMSTMTIDVLDENVTLNISNASVTAADGLHVDDYVTVTYMGDLNNPEGVSVVSVIADDAKNAANHHVTGTITDASMNVITIETPDGATFTFLKEDAVINADDINIGTTVKITYDETQETDDNTYTAKQIDPVA